MVSMTTKSIELNRIGKRLRQWRLERGLSFAEIAKETGISESTLRKIAFEEVSRPQEMTIFLLKQKYPDLFDTAA